MGTLVLVRHGQASFGASDYDQLSPLGEQQARRLGAHEVAEARGADAVFVGPLRRHRQTEALFREAYGPGLPEATLIDGLDEHALVSLISTHRHEVLRQRPETLSLLQPRAGEAPAAAMRRFLMAVAQDWVSGALVVDDLEPWSAFRERVTRTLARMISGHPPGARLLAFTSGGFMGAVAGHLLGLDHPRTFDVSSNIRNTALVEVRFPSDATRCTLDVYNATPHLSDPSLITRL